MNKSTLSGLKIVLDENTDKRIFLDENSNQLYEDFPIEQNVGSEASDNPSEDPVPVEIFLIDNSFETSKKVKSHDSNGFGTYQTQKSLKCKYCDFTSVWPVNIKRHTESKHDNNEYPCSVCSYVGQNLRSYKYHMMKHREKLQGGSVKNRVISHKKCFQNKTYECHICQKAEKSQYLLQKHIASAHTGDWNIPVKCDLCDFVARNKRGLQYHMKKHEGMIYLCDKCSYTSPTKDQLRNHSNSKHGELKIKCDYCEFKFPAKWRLEKHMKRIHSFQRSKKLKTSGGPSNIIHGEKAYNQKRTENEQVGIVSFEIQRLDNIVWRTDQPLVQEHNVDDISSNFVPQ